MTLALYLNTCTPPNARVFVQPYLPQVLGMAQRGFAAGFGDLRPGFFDEPEFEALALRRMRGQDVPVVLLDVEDSLENFRESFPVLTAYFDATYETAATHVFDDRFGITLLVRKGVTDKPDIRAVRVAVLQLRQKKGGVHAHPALGSDALGLSVVWSASYIEAAPPPIAAPTSAPFLPLIRPPTPAPDAADPPTIIAVFVHDRCGRASSVSR